MPAIMPPDSAHTPCDLCNGRGFTRKGAFTDNAFLVCGECKGIGQFYIRPPVDRPEPLQALDDDLVEF